MHHLLLIDDNADFRLVFQRKFTDLGYQVHTAGDGVRGLQIVFDPFYTTKRIGAGSGLGLSIVAGIVRAHQGTIRAQSKGPGQGATFTITLPTARDG